MAIVAPFRAIRFDCRQTPDLGLVTTPPYDVIDPEQQDAFYKTDPHNIIRVELNKPEPADNEEDNVYRRAAGFFRQWLEEGVLRQDPEPAFYFNETTYKNDQGQTLTRHGFFCALRLEDFSAGVVLPHERTFTKHKEDRLLLTKATGANISPILGLFPGHSNKVNTILAAAESKLLASFVDCSGLGQKFYMVTDPGVCRQVRDILAAKKVYIADGHHRYETGLNYRNYMRSLHPEAGPEAAFNYVLTYLCSMGEPGLTVFATQRVLPKADNFQLTDFLAKAGSYFQIEEIPVGDRTAALSELNKSMSQAQVTRLGLAVAGQPNIYLLTIKPEALSHPALQREVPLMRELDTVVLTELLIHNLLGLDEKARDQVHSIKYVAGLRKAAEMVWDGQAQLAFLLNPTKISQMKAVAEAGLIMPRKSTYFYPKVLTGLVMNPLNPLEKMSV